MPQTQLANDLFESVKVKIPLAFWSEPCFKSSFPSHNVAFHIWSVQLPPTHCDEGPPKREMMIEW